MAQATSPTVQGIYSTAWRSVWDLVLKPQFKGKIYNRYGKGFGILDFLRAAEADNTPLRGRTHFFFEKGAIEKLATIGSGGISTSSAGANVTFTLAAGDYDANDNGYLRVNDSIWIPEAYTGTTIPLVYVIISKSGTGAATTYTAKPMSSTSAITTTVPAGTELIVGADYYAPGTNQPAGTTTGWYQRDFYTQITKETLTLEGGQQALETYLEMAVREDRGGGMGLFSEAMLQTEFLMDAKMDKAMFMSELNSNSLTGTTSDGTSNATLSGKGYLNWVDELAQEHNYSGSWTLQDFDEIKFLHETQGVTEEEVAFCYGSRLGLDVERVVLDYIKGYSSGSDLTTSKLGKNMIDLGVKTIGFYKNNRHFILKELASFSNPNSYGATAYNFPYWGFMIPMGQVSVYNERTEGGVIKLPYLSVGYLKGNGVDRTRVFKTSPGMDGQGAGNVAVTSYDESSWYLLSEWALTAAKINQHIFIQKS